MDAIRFFGPRIPILGVCLGHQAICQCYGATVSYAKELVHGKAYDVEVDTESPLFRGMKSPIKAARYHSLAAVESTMPSCLKITARTRDGEIMAVEHRDYPTYGLQFHPESIMTPEGGKILKTSSPWQKREENRFRVQRVVDCPAGNAYEICVTGFGFVLPVLQDEEPEPPSLRSGWRQPPKGGISSRRRRGYMVFSRP